jgi:hypothetical protein
VEEYSDCVVIVSPEDWGCIFLLNVGIQLQDYTESQLRKAQSEHGLHEHVKYYTTMQYNFQM